MRARFPIVPLACFFSSAYSRVVLPARCAAALKLPFVPACFSRLLSAAIQFLAIAFRLKLVAPVSSLHNSLDDGATIRTFEVNAFPTVIFPFGRMLEFDFTFLELFWGHVLGAFCPLMPHPTLSRLPRAFRVVPCARGTNRPALEICRALAYSPAVAPRPISSISPPAPSELFSPSDSPSSPPPPPDAMSICSATWAALGCPLDVCVWPSS